MFFLYIVFIVWNTIPASNDVKYQVTIQKDKVKITLMYNKITL